MPAVNGAGLTERICNQLCYRPPSVVRAKSRLLGLRSHAPVAQLDSALVSGCKSGNQTNQAKPTNFQRNLVHRKTALGLNCSLLAGVVGQFIGQSARKPEAEGRNQNTCRALRKKQEKRKQATRLKFRLRDTSNQPKSAAPANAHRKQVDPVRFPRLRIRSGKLLQALTNRQGYADR